MLFIQNILSSKISERNLFYIAKYLVHWVRKREIYEVDRFQLKRGRALEAESGEWESRREKENISRLSYIAIECGLAVSGTYQAVKLLAYLPWRTNEWCRNEAHWHEVASLLVVVIVVVVVVLDCLVLRNQIACVGRFAGVTTIKPSDSADAREVGWKYPHAYIAPSCLPACLTACLPSPVHARGPACTGDALIAARILPCPDRARCCPKNETTACSLGVIEGLAAIRLLEELPPTTFLEANYREIIPFIFWNGSMTDLFREN